MDIRKDYRYYVVEFLDPPHSRIDQYVCIPDSWIQLREIADQVVVTKFPVENLSITQKRVKDGEVFSDGWSIYVAEVKYGTDSYEDAEKYIKTLKEKLTNIQSCSGPVNNGDRLPKLSKSLRRSKRNKSNLSVNKPQISDAPSYYSIEPVSEIETPEIQTNGVETINSANEITVRRKNNTEKSNNVDSIEIDNGPQGIAGNESPANQNGSQLTNESLDAIIINEPISDTGNPGQVKNASEFNLNETLLLLDHMRDGYFQCCKSLEKLMDSINNQYYCGSYNPFNPTIKDTVAPVVEEKEREEKETEKKRQVAKRTQAETGISRRRETERNEQNIDDSADNNDEDANDNDDGDDYVKRKRFQSKRTQAETGIIRRRETERNEQEIDDSADNNDEDANDNDDGDDYVKRKRFQSKRTQAEIGIIRRRETERNEQKIDDSADNNDEDANDNDDGDDYVKRKRFQSKRTQAEIGIIRRRETERNEQEIDDSADNNDEDDNDYDDDYVKRKRFQSKRTQAEIGIIRRETERNEQEIDDSADNNDEDDNNNDDDDGDDYVKRKRFQSRKLTLPPEYDKNDSKWTLRYREYAPGLVELIEHTGVYINAVKLVNCKRLAKNSKTLARLLLVEIFKESALWTCSLTGVRAKAFDIDGTRIRPGLDENARTVLLTYVDQYAQASKWPKTDNQSILNSIRNKMQEIRFKLNK